MESQVEKMYENAGVEVKNKCKSSQCIVTNPHPDWCNKCESLSKAYPPFTAEKQLELIKWLCQKTYRNYLLIRYNFTNYFWQIECNMIDSDKLDNFAETIASMINNLWQDLTEEERKQIKEILE